MYMYNGVKFRPTPSILGNNALRQHPICSIMSVINKLIFKQHYKEVHVCVAYGVSLMTS